jgi:hypothetical protein
MNIPEAIIEPFGYDIPTLVMVRQGNNPALLTKIFLACNKAFADAVRQWKIKNHCKKNGLPYVLTSLDPDLLKLRAVFAGGKDVNCEIEEFKEHFYMSITFNIEGDPSRYGSHEVYPDDENAEPR